MGKPWKTRAETIKAPDPSADICSSADGLVEAAELLQGQEPWVLCGPITGCGQLRGYLCTRRDRLGDTTTKLQQNTKYKNIQKWSNMSIRVYSQILQGIKGVENLECSISWRSQQLKVSELLREDSFASSFGLARRSGWWSGEMFPAVVLCLSQLQELFCEGRTSTSVKSLASVTLARKKHQCS